MIETKKITAENLSNPSLAEDYFKDAEKLMSFPSKQTKEVAEKIYKVLYLDRDSLSSIEKRYKQITNKMRFAALWFYDEKDVIIFFKRYLYVALGLEEIDVKHSLKTKLIDMSIYDRDGFKKKIREAIESNKQIVGTTEIITEDGPKKSTINAWVSDYLRYVNTQVSSGGSEKIRQQQYYGISKNYRNLSEQDQKKIRELLVLYEGLKKSSLTPEGLEETILIKEADGNYYNLEAGVTEKLLKINKTKEKSPIGTKSSASGIADPMDALKSKYNTYRRARWDELKIEDEVLVQTKGDIPAVKKELSSAAREVNKNKLIACVKILARQGYFMEALVGSPAWMNALGEYIITKYTARSDSDQIAQAVSALKQDYKNPAIISEFLQYLLVEKLKISQNESALTAIEISQLLGKDYETIAYGNQETGDFEWTNIKVVDSRLALE